MNYLAHVLLAGEHPEHQLGALMADFVRGRPETLLESYSEQVVHGIVGHRAVDKYADAHPAFRKSRARISAERRRVSGIIIDVVYDYFLSHHWARFSDTPKRQFIDSFYETLATQHTIMPTRMQRMAPRMINGDWLGDYENLDTIGLVLDRIAERMRRTKALRGSIDEVVPILPELEADFLNFFPELQTHMKTALLEGR